MLSSGLSMRLRRKLRQTLLNLNPLRFRADTLLLQADRAPAPSGQVAVFNHFDAAGEVADYVEGHLQALQALGLSIVFVTTSPRLTAAALQRLAPCCWMVLLRPNRGLDLGGWPCAVRRIEAVLAKPLQQAVHRLVVANDSVFGPLRPLGPVFEAMAPHGADIWGITESIEREPHLQSYFLVFEQQGLVFVRDWLRRFQFLEDKDALVSRFEIGLSREARRQGLNLQALVSYAALRSWVQTEPASLRAAVLQRYVQTQGRINPTHVFWRELLTRLGSPYVKRDLLRNPLQLDPAAEPCLPFLAAHTPGETFKAIAAYLDPGKTAETADEPAR